MIILDDFFGLKLWGENIFRRLSNHLYNNNYDTRRKPFLFGPLLMKMGNHNLKSFLRFYMFVLLCTFKPVYSLLLLF